MQKRNTIGVELKEHVATISLNRPEVHNALNLEMIRELTTSIRELELDDRYRIVVLTSHGKHFSAGADLNWMQNGMKHSPEQLKKESMELANLFRAVSESDLIIVTSVQGKVVGGANGLVAASDIVLAERYSSFTFPEVKLGLVPATIAPYVMKKAGYSRTSEWMISGRSIGAAEAKSEGLVHHLCNEGELKKRTDEILDELLANGPEAMKGIKQLLHKLGTGMPQQQIQEYTADIIAKFRISPEGQEGIRAFLEKRRPGWSE